MKHAKPSDEARVLVIYTGGTIGMLFSPHGYVPEPFFLTETLRRQKRFHDPFEDSLFSNSASVEGYRVWSTSGTSTPITPEMQTASNLKLIMQHPTFLVRSSRPIGTVQTLRLGQNAPPTAAQYCEKISEDVYQARLPTLVTPRSTVSDQSGNKRIRYSILEACINYLHDSLLNNLFQWTPLQDSSNVEMDGQ